MLNGAKKAKEKNLAKLSLSLEMKKIINFQKLGDINFWIDSKAYNLIENAHQALLLSLVDYIIGKKRISSKLIKKLKKNNSFSK